MRYPRYLPTLPSPPNPFHTLHCLSDLHYPSTTSSTAPDSAAAAAIRLHSCSDTLELSQIHAFVLRRNLLHLSFHWNSLMRGYLRLSIPSASLQLFLHMTRAGTYPDHYSLPIAVKAAFTSFSFSIGHQLHSVAIKHGLSRHQFSESALISLYAKAGDFIPANQLFEENPHRNLGSWNALISSYAQAGHSSKALSLFTQLRRTGEIPDEMTLVSIASACGTLGDILLAEQIHGCAIQARTTLDTKLSNSLIDMYAKCGRTDLALKVFDSMPVRDVSSWTAMIMGLATQGNPTFALELFRRMKEEGRVAANHVTMVAVLCACANAGLVEEGMRNFEAIVEGRVKGVEATEAHYGCVADMLGKVGRVREAVEMVEGMRCPASAVVWGSLLGACEKHGEVRIGEKVAAKLVELEPWNDGVYVVLSNIYAGEGMWEEVERVRRLMRDRKVGKIPGYSLPDISSWLGEMNFV
ncbi:hypothetical protein IEQ34_021684 [Dendrobium chrysotoxum]|uniref:Pentatricopeptide repeat-containing protein n=1 Tax=Dendrobium chrysotoxum TaxID=161865 RepID=A0AAV7G659_DENCH|nr:hypothetical protein IEQ34_021684 [Dendrobium chrysotoxum]